MKKSRLLLLLTLLCFGWMAKAQVRQHDGFYLSMAAGPVFGSVTGKSTAANVTFSGVGTELDFKIGWAVKENIILHATLNGKVVTGYTLDDGSTERTASDNSSLGESFLGGGATYYIMPSNFFVSASLGVGFFSVNYAESNTGGSRTIDASTQKGFSMQLKAGKEWWVSDNWGLGVAITYGKTILTSTSNNITEDWDSNRFGVLFSATFN